jgi:hypothetical protein
MAPKFVTAYRKGGKNDGNDRLKAARPDPREISRPSVALLIARRASLALLARAQAANDFALAVVDEQIGWNFLPVVVVAALPPLNVCLCHRKSPVFKRRTTAVYQGA